MPEQDPTDPGTPIFHETMAMFGPRFNESPWAPDLLVVPDPATITGQIDMLKRRVYSAADTQLIPVIEVADEPQR